MTSANPAPSASVENNGGEPSAGVQGILARCGAFVVDLVLCGLVVSVLEALHLGGLTTTIMGLFVIALYQAVFLRAFSSTIGMWIFSIRLQSDRAMKIPVFVASIRGLVYAIVTLAILNSEAWSPWAALIFLAYLASCSGALWTRSGVTLHDSLLGLRRTERSR